ncbi:MAG: hypothetical protein ACHRXM_30270 [Isosphaerales bacterium]
MSDSEVVHVDVAVALVTDDNQRVLVTFHESWGMFTLPMTRRRRGSQSPEPRKRAVLRAAVHALGVPVRLVEEGPRRVLGRLQSGRQLVDKIYTYNVFHVEPHPDFAGRLQIQQPHLWLSPHLILSGAYEPISESARFILRSVLDDFEIPARIQHTSALIVQRDDPERGREFLVRWNRDWGYALPTKRWPPPDSTGPADLTSTALAGAKRVAREELGLEPATDVTLTPARSPELTTHGVSATKGSPAFEMATQYIHSLFDARLRHPDKLHSDKPLAWVTQDEIHQAWTAGAHPAPDSSPQRAGRISRTVYEILQALGVIAEIDPPEVLEEIVDLSKRIEARMRAPSSGDEP